jgi:serine/threonine protein kinase
MLHADRHSATAGKALRDEALRMSKLRHTNIVQLLAVCFDSAPNFIVVEFMPLGDLKSVLRRCQKNSTPLNTVHKLYICSDVANGAAYLSSQGFIHRDIAARNVLVNARWIAKIGDFGNTSLGCQL